MEQLFVDGTRLFGVRAMVDRNQFYALTGGTSHQAQRTDREVGSLLLVAKHVAEPTEISFKARFGYGEVRILLELRIVRKRRKARFCDADQRDRVVLAGLPTSSG
jgi:hypothetical protein